MVKANYIKIVISLKVTKLKFLYCTGVPLNIVRKRFYMFVTNKTNKLINFLWPEGIELWYFEFSIFTAFSSTKTEKCILAPSGFTSDVINALKSTRAACKIKLKFWKFLPNFSYVSFYVYMLSTDNYIFMNFHHFCCLVLKISLTVSFMLCYSIAQEILSWSI